MKRRDFVKTSLCLGCAGAVGAGIPLCKNAVDFKNIKQTLALRKFMYKNEKELPVEIKLDLCNLCQLNCVECWIRKNEEQIKSENGGFGYVSFETFKKFVDKHSFIKHIECSNQGEIFLNPDLEKILKYAYEKGISLSAGAGVNLNTLSEEMAEALVKYKFNFMNISIDGATPETYAIYRRGGDFNKVINNIKTINKYKEKYNSEYPIMVYKFILFGHNEHEIEEAKKLAKKLDMDIEFDINSAKNYSPVKNPEKVLKETGLNTLNLNIDKQFQLYKEGKDNWFYCNAFYETPQINFNGDLLGCCMNILQSFKVNVFKEGLLNALNNERVLYAKYMLSDFSAKPRDDIHCSKCYVYDYLKEKNSPMTQESIKAI